MSSLEASSSSSYITRMGCTASLAYVSPDGDDVKSRGPVTWTMTDSNGRRLTMNELKATIKISLTEPEVCVITRSWKMIRRNMTNIGVAMFLRCDVPSSCKIGLVVGYIVGGLMEMMFATHAAIA